MAALRERKVEEEVAMSDAGLLLSVEDLISLAFGNIDASLINFNMLESIINVLARQMRVLEHDVEIRFDEHEDNLIRVKKLFGAPITEAEKAAAEAKAAAEREAAEREAAERAAAEAVEEEQEPIVVQQLSGGSVAKSDSQTRIGAIDAICPRKFHEVNNQVIELLRRTKGDPRVHFALPTLPSTEDFLGEIAKGTVSMMEVMNALQVLGRIETAESVISKMAELLTQLALSGDLPEGVTDIIAQMLADMARIQLETDEKAETVSEETIEQAEEFDFVTHPELDDALYEIEEEYKQNAAERFAKNREDIQEVQEESRCAAEKMGIALRLDRRTKNMQNILDGNNDRLDDVDISMHEQIEAFNELMAELRAEIDAGIERFESLNNNAETIALNNYRAGYEDMLVDLEQATNAHGVVAMGQKRLSEDLKFMSSTLHLLTEDKADRDEVLDGLKEKANLTRLRGLITQPTFERFRQDIKNKLKLTLENFEDLDHKWLSSLCDLREIVETKACFMSMFNLKEFVNQAIIEQYAILRRLDALLGDPKTAILTRKLAVDSHCGACVTPALMDVYDKRNGAPPQLPAMRRRGVVSGFAPTELTCSIHDTAIPDPRRHMCHRFVGGSHTLLTDHAHSHKGEELSLSDTAPTRRYAGKGKDGRLYLLEEELQPCRECNDFEMDKITHEMDGIEITPEMHEITPEMDVMQTPLVLTGGDNA